MNCAPQIEERDIDWNKVEVATFQVEYWLRYEYPGPIEGVHNVLMVVPADHMGFQDLVAHELTVNPAAQPRYDTDRFGNRLCHVTLARVEQTLDFRLSLCVRRYAGRAVPLQAGWEADIYAMPSPLTEPCPDLAWIAADLTRRSPSDAVSAERIGGWVSAHVRYTPGATNVRSTAQDALERAQGVCQDYAHLMIALCRLAKLPARYVSGYMLGEGAMHAWTEVLLADGDGGERAWYAFDPTHAARAGIPYIVAAVGRDYSDVSPTRGTFRAAFPGPPASGRVKAHVVSLGMP